MHRLFLKMCIFLLAFSVQAQDRATIEFLVMRLDYQSMNLKHVYHFEQPIDMASLTNSQQRFHGLDVEVTPAGDFGGTKILSAYTGDIVYNATTFWMGTGEHRFPTDEFEITTGDTNFLGDRHPKFHDFADYFFSGDDFDAARQAYEAVRAVKLPLVFAGNSAFGLLTYLHYFSVGENDPTTAEWIFIFYSLPEDPPPYLRYQWHDVTNNLPNSLIYTIATHNFFGDSLWIGNNKGAFFSHTGGDDWQPVEFGDNSKVPVKTLTTIPNPYVDCLCSVVGLGTEEPNPALSKVSGRVFRSMLDGEIWEDMKAPEIGVSAIAFNYWNPSSIYAGLYNPFLTNENGLYQFNGQQWQGIDFAPQLSNLPKINCISIDTQDTTMIFVGTTQGVFFTNKDMSLWKHVLPSFNISSIVITYLGFKRQIYVSTNGAGRSDGIWASFDDGENWEVLSWERQIVALVQDRFARDFSPTLFGRFYMAVYNQGVFVSSDGCRNWREINQGLPEKAKKVTSLAVHPSKIRQLYLGTEEGIYKYLPMPSTPIDLSIQNDDLAYWPPRPRDGELVEIYATVHNHSRVPVYNIDVSFVDNADGNLQVIVPIDTLTIPMIPPGSDYTLRAEWYPRNQQGENIIFVKIDPLNRIREANENNNSARINVFLDQPPEQRTWKDITHNLIDPWINDIAAHPFINEKVFIATRRGAYSNVLTNVRYWSLLKFTDPETLNVTQIDAEPHPYLEWAVPTIVLGTEEYTLIPEERNGRVLISENGGTKWFDTKFPNIAVSALEAPTINAFNTFAASYNPFYNLDSFFMLKDSNWVEFDLTPDNNETIRINCFYVDNEFKNIMVGTSDGLFVSKDSGINWKREFPNFEIVSIITHTGYRQKVIYIATSGRSKSDGIYRRYFETNSWEVVSYFTNIASLISATGGPAESAAPHFYVGIYNRGVLESRNGGNTWDDITDNTINLKITCLASGRFNPNVLFLGTEKGIFKFDKSTSTTVAQNENKAPEPKQFELYQNYPNPFNNSTNINYYIPADMSGGAAEMTVYNSLGQEVRSYVFENQSPGMHKASWDGRDQRGMTVYSGIYLFRIKYGGTSRTMKAVFLK